MMSYVYAVTDRPFLTLPPQLGLDDQVLARIVFRDLGAVVSVHDGSHVTAAADKVWRHEQVVESLMSAHAVLPMRYGTLLASLDEVEGMLRRGYPMFVDDLTRVRDHVEIGIRFMVLRETAAIAATGGNSQLLQSDAPAPSATAPGTAYLRTKLTKEHERRDRHRVDLELVRKTYRILAEHAAAAKLEDDRGDAPAVSAAFLVQRGDLVPFRQLVERLADTEQDLALLCTGPWPAYSFVSTHPCQPTQRAGSCR